MWIFFRARILYLLSVFVIVSCGKSENNDTLTILLLAYALTPLDYTVQVNTTRGPDGVPSIEELSTNNVNYEVDGVDTWWENHRFNPDHSERITDIRSPEPILDVYGEYGSNIQAAIDALPATGGTLFFAPTTFAIPAQGIYLAGKSNVHFIGVEGKTTFIASSDKTMLTLECGTGEISGYPDCYSQATHGIVDKNIFIRGTGYPINGWHSWRNFVVTRNFVASTWGGFIADGPASEAQGPYGPGKDHLVAQNIFWKVTERNSHNGATLISENTHFINNILAGKYDNNSDEPDSIHYTGTGGISVDRNESSGNYYKNLSNFQILDNAYYNLTLGMIDTDETADRNFTLDVVDDWNTRHNAKKEGTYTPAMKANSLTLTESEIDTRISEIDTFFTSEMTNTRMTNILNDTTIEEKFSGLQTMTVPAASPIYQKGDSWYEAGKKVNIGPDATSPRTPNEIWQEFSERGFVHYNATGGAFVTQ